MTSTDLDARTRAELTELLDHMDAGHADTVLFIARYAGDRPAASDASTSGVDATGLDLDVVADGRPERVRLTFARPIGSSAEAYEQLLGLLSTARAVAGERVPLTSTEREMATLGSLPTFVSEVAEVRDLSPNLREIVLTGGLDGFASSGSDQFVYLMVRRPGGPEVPVGHTMAAQQSADSETAPLGAYYTVRSWDPERRRLVLWVVLHGHGSGVGGWATRCTVGERVALWGPRHGIDVQPRPHLFVVDESGLAAVAAILDELPPGTPTRVMAETVDADHVVELPTTGDTQIDWHFRGDAAPGSGTRLLDAVRSCTIGDAVVFGAGESRQMTAIRRLVRHERGLPAEDVSVIGYWRR